MTFRILPLSAENGPSSVTQDDGLTIPLKKFVSGATLDLLGRPASAMELRGWVNQLVSGVNRTTLATCLLNSSERRAQLVKTSYQRLLKRDPAVDAVRYWCDQLSSGKTHEEFIAGILSSPEYVALCGPKNEHFIRALYRDALVRRPTADEVDSWVGLLSSGSASQTAVAYQFVISDDFRRRMVREWYWTYLDREPDADTVEFSVEQLRLGHSAEMVQAQILATREYFNRVLVKN